MRKLLRVGGIVAATLVAVCAFGNITAAQEQPADPFSTYQPLRCQNQRDGSVTCTYPNGQQASNCTTSTPFTGTTRYECTNPDNGKTQCDRSATGNLDGNSAGTQTVCRVYDSNGTLITTRDTTNQGGRTTGRVTGSDGTEQEIDESNMTPPGDSCGWTNMGACFRNFPGMLFVAVGFIFLTLSGMILFVAGTVFNWVVLRTVFQFGEYFGTSDGMLVAWGVMRDIANIGLLFGFILMGVLLILNVDGGGHGHGGGISAKRAIPRLIIFAVLLNFSLFASQFVIDVANAFGSSFTSLAGTECSTAVTTEAGNNGGQSLEECSNLGISGKVLQAAGLTNIFGDGRGDLQAILSNLAGRPYSYAVSLIMLSIFVLVTAFVLLAGAIMLVIRVVVLSFLMVTSPIGFAGMVIPGLGKIASQWWHTLISQSFFAPVYLLLIFISIKLTEGLMQGEASLTNAIIADKGVAISGNIQVVMVFLIVIGFMIASLITAQKLGAMGAGAATAFAGRAVTYPLSAGGRMTLGRGSARALKTYETAMGRARNSNNKFVSTIAKSPLGNVVDDAAVGTLTAGKNAKFFGGRSYAEETKHRDERADHLEHARAQAEQKETLKAAIKSGVDADIQKSLQKMGAGDIKKVLEDSKVDLDAIARNVSPEKFADLMKDKDISEDKKHRLQHGRFAPLEQVASTAGTSAGFSAAKGAVKSWSGDDLVEFAKADPSSFAKLIQATDVSGSSVLTKDQRETLEKAKGLSNAQRQMVKDSSPVGRINAAVKGGRVVLAGTIAAGITSPKDKAKLDRDALMTPAVIDTLTAGDLKELQSEAKLKDADRRAIMSRINASTKPNHQSIKNYLRDAGTDTLVKAYWS